MRGGGINYEVECQLCPVGERSLYIGESSRNLYTRSKEHESYYRAGMITSFMVKHQMKTHRGEEPDYKAKVTASTRDCLTRQIREAVLIRRSQVEVLNSKSEWHQPALYRVQHEVERGQLCCDMWPQYKGYWGKLSEKNFGFCGCDYD